MSGFLRRLRDLGKFEKLFCGLATCELILTQILPDTPLLMLLRAIVVVLAIGIAFRLLTVALRRVIWSLRNRLLVTYLFIAVVPVSLILVLAAVGIYTAVSQLAVYLAVSDLNHRTAELSDLASKLTDPDLSAQPDVVRRTLDIHRTRFPGLALSLLGDEPPPPSWGPATGVMVRRGQFHLWAHAVKGELRVSVVAPLSRSYLSNMVPGLTDVSLLDISDSRTAVSAGTLGGERTYLRQSHEPPAYPVLASANRFDPEMHWFSTVPVWRWESPGKQEHTLLHVHTRPSALLNAIFNTRVDQNGELLPIALLVLTVLFLLVQLVALIIGVSLTHTITSAVHNLYEGTQRVIQGDFSHRILVRSRDQLGELGTSFNMMTEHLERLLAVAKEKERLQAEVEIARQVQEQLYPKVIPVSQSLRLTAVCRPARMVSGDYYDYLCLPDGRLAIAIGDVAGKGISSALLMANIQAALRMVLRTSSGEGSLPSARLVSDLNQQLYATTSPEKYATFFFAFFHEASGELTYTNAGHLAPLLIRGLKAVPLEVSGTVIGAFPTARYDENRIAMLPGDLLVCYTDGITEPENEYGEEFGEARLIDLIVKNIDQEEKKILTVVLDAVSNWTSAKEQPDDMTLLLAKRLPISP